MQENAMYKAKAKVIKGTDIEMSQTIKWQRRTFKKLS